MQAGFQSTNLSLQVKCKYTNHSIFKIKIHTKMGKLLGNDKHVGHLTCSDTLQLFLLHSLEHYGYHVQLAQSYGKSQGIFLIIQLITITN